MDRGMTFISSLKMETEPTTFSTRFTDQRVSLINCKMEKNGTDTRPNWSTTQMFGQSQVLYNCNITESKFYHLGKRWRSVHWVRRLIWNIHGVIVLMEFLLSWMECNSLHLCPLYMKPYIVNYDEAM